MRSILFKEIRLSASVLSFLFIIFSFMFFLPGYPVLCGAFFVTLGLYQSFQNAREANDIVFSALLPIAKKDVVKGKYIFVCLVELCSLIIMALITVLRMTVLANSTVYRNNAMMNVNLFTLGFAFLIYGLFNLIFVGGFFKTAYKFGKPFVLHTIVTFTVILIAEATHHIPGLEFVNTSGFEKMGFQAVSLITGLVLFLVLTAIAYKKSCYNFDKIDL